MRRYNESSGSTMDDAYQNAKAASDYMAIRTVVLPLYSDWSKCKQVIRLDERLSESLCRTECPLDAPMDYLRRLPYQCMFVETAPWDCEALRFEAGGFFVRYDSSDRNALYIVMVGKDGNDECYGMRPIILDAPTLKGGIIAGLPPEIQGRDYEALPGHILRVKCTQYALSHLCYICSDYYEENEVVRPSGCVSRKRARTQSQATIHSAGRRIGSDLRAKCTAYVSQDQGGTHRSPVMHWRKGHWQHYWVGPRNDPSKRHRILCWKQPILVNADTGQTDDRVVIHSA